MNDFRLHLWFPLPIEDKLKMLLFQTNEVEAKFMILFIILEYGQVMKLLKPVENKIEKVLDDLIYRVS
jgi:hypothetical protein